MTYSQAQIYGRSSGWLYTRLRNVRGRKGTKFDKNEISDSGESINAIYQLVSHDENADEDSDIASNVSLATEYLEYDENSTENKIESHDDVIEYDFSSDNEA